MLVNPHGTTSAPLCCRSAVVVRTGRRSCASKLVLRSRAGGGHPSHRAVPLGMAQRLHPSLPSTPSAAPPIGLDETRTERCAAWFLRLCWSHRLWCCRSPPSAVFRGPPPSRQSALLSMPRKGKKTKHTAAEINAKIAANKPRGQQRDHTHSEGRRITRKGGPAAHSPARRPFRCSLAHPVALPVVSRFDAQVVVRLASRSANPRRP